MKSNRLAKEYKIKSYGDSRGELIPFEFSELPFLPVRNYVLRNTTMDTTRGQHAHRDLKQLIVCLSGSLSIMLDDGSYRELYNLSHKSDGLLIEGIIWRELSNFSKNCVVLVFADKPYLESDYIRTYDEFLKMKKNDQV